MKKIHIIHVGDFKEEWLRLAMAEYAKRISPCCELRELAVREESLPERPSAAQIAAALEREGARAAERLPPRSYTAALCVEGRRMNSEGFAALVEEALEKRDSLSFVIGSSYGLAESVKNAADLRISLSDLTLPHMLARVLLAEQIYRALTIMNGGKYHK